MKRERARSLRKTAPYGPPASKCKSSVISGMDARAGFVFYRSVRESATMNSMILQAKLAAVLFAMMLLAIATFAQSPREMERGFQTPPDSAKPRVYWWWLNSRVSKEGITRDLEEYRAKGIGGVLLFDAGMPAGPMPSGPKFMSAEWLEMVQHDLGKVKNVARVRLNGKDLGVVWTAPWRVEITDAVKRAGNVLEIDVVNLWPNRLIGDAALPESQRVARTHIEFRPDQPLLSSGLLGPVTLQAAERVQGQ
jgi:hypothetical protein